MGTESLNGSAQKLALMALLLFMSLPAMAIDQVTECSDETFNVVLKPVCPAPEEAEAMTFFEDAKHPILSVEVAPVTLFSIMAGIGPSFPAPGPVRPGALLKTIDLLSENYFRSPQNRHELKIHYAYGFPPNQQTKLMILVCNDSNGDGKCSDEPVENHLVPDTQSYRPCHLPKVINIPVWAGCR